MPARRGLSVGAERDQRAEGAVDVQPEVLLGADVGERREIVDRAGVDRARGPDHEERPRAAARSAAMRCASAAVSMR